MQVVQTVIEGISMVLGGWMMFMLVYQLGLSMFGFGKQTKDYADHDPKSRFLVLVPAHNEETVIRDIIENLQHMEYPKELYDFYVIADNCTDRTADVARQMGANVIETFKEDADSPTGKPIAIKKALDQLAGYENQYDLMMIFDADNLIDPNMLLEVNSQYLDKDRPELIQCYLGMKNKKGLVAWFYYTCFTTSNRFVQLARARRGLNCGIGGTGYAVDTQYLKSRGGWTTMTLTEDFEIQIEATIAGKRILWNHNARVYDEKPTKWMVSLRQRIRWAQGQWFVTLKNIFKLLSAVIHKRISIREGISCLMYMGTLFVNVIMVIQILIEIVFLATGLTKVSAGAVWDVNIPSAIVFVYSFLVLFYAGDWLDNRIGFSFSSLGKMLVSTVINLVLASFAQVWGLFLHRKQNQWVKTDHHIQCLDGDHAHLTGNASLLSENVSHQGDA